MKDNTFLKLALGWALIGIFLLMLTAVYTEPETVSVIDLENYLGKTVVVKGVVGNTNYKEKVSFIELEDDSGLINVVAFDDLPKKVYKKDEVAVKGEVKLYKGELEIIVREIYCIKCWN